MVCRISSGFVKAIRVMSLVKFIPMIVLIVTSFTSIASNIISLEEKRRTYRPSKKCESLLVKKEPSAVLTFRPSDLVYMNRESFFEKPMLNNEFYFFSSNPPVFKESSDGVWSALPKISSEEGIYILKVRAYEPHSISVGRLSSWSVRELKEQFKLLAFTRIRISPLYSLIREKVEHLRGQEVYQSNISYEAPGLVFNVDLIQSSAKVGLIAYINSWSPISRHEEMVKEEMKSFMETTYSSLEEKQAAIAFLSAFP